MSQRTIITIDEAKCDGCGRCVSACAEGAIAIRDGKAKLVSDVYCDGLGACLGDCPRGAIRLTQREAAPFDQKAVGKPLPVMTAPRPQCPLPIREGDSPIFVGRKLGQSPGCLSADAPLSHWPIQLRLVSPPAAFFHDADLLLVADCVPFACADFHSRFLHRRPLVIACPKLDDREAALEKLTAILTASSVRSVTVVHMEVPCCTGLVRLAQAAITATGRDIPLQDTTISVGGREVG